MKNVVELYIYTVFNKASRFEVLKIKVFIVKQFDLIFAKSNGSVRSVPFFFLLELFLV